MNEPPSLVERMMLLEEWIDDLEALVRWLARSYGDNDPILPFQSAVTDTSGETHVVEHPENVRNYRTWMRVVREA